MFIGCNMKCLFAESKGENHQEACIILISKMYYFLHKLCGAMVHCHHGSSHQLLGNQLLLGTDATTHVFIITGSFTILGKKHPNTITQDYIIKLK